MRIQEFDYAINLAQAILWQYDEAKYAQELNEKKQAYYDKRHTAFWTDWYRDVFNLQTANSFGLAVWSILLGLPLFIDINPDPPDKPIWGFGEYKKNFNNGNFANSQKGIILTIEQRRLILKLRYFQLVTRGAAPEVNSFLKFAFKDYGDVWMLDGLDMSITYVFNFTIDDLLLSVLQTYDILPRPAGVKIKYVVTTRPTFGFGEYFENFENGNFINEY